MDLQLTGKTALITGSSKGIGEAIARTLAREGAIVIVHGRDEAQTEWVAHDIVAEGGRAHGVIGDLTQDEAVERLVRQARDLVGPIAILVNNAGGSGGARGGLEDCSACVMGVRLRSQCARRAKGHHPPTAQHARRQMGLLPAPGLINWCNSLRSPVKVRH
jgi:NAD(P)-dependent dehydrogenase (short-subunit alcohol dehydrogenase family)